MDILKIMKEVKLLLNKYIAAYEFPVVIEKEKGGFFAFCPLWRDCYAQGDTLEEALNEITSAASGLIELYKEEGIDIPLKRKAFLEKIKRETKLKMPLYVTQ